MSLASDYAVSQAAADARKVSANEAAPQPYGSTQGTATVDPDGSCRIVPTGTNAIVLKSGEAVALANWILATFA